MLKGRGYTAAFLCVLFIILGKSCQVDQQIPASSFALIQEKVLTPSCAFSGCHGSASDETFVEHGLILEQSVAYDNLVGLASKNINAAAEGMLRVKPFEPEMSLLYHKIDIESHGDMTYGNPMPLGLNKLSQGQVEFIGQWIAAGAPRSGAVADPALLDDQTIQVEPFEPLAPPAAGTGFQINLEKFHVNPNFEREFFVYKPLNNSSDIFINRFEIKMRANSHHIVLYDFEPGTPSVIFPQPEVVRDIRNPDNSLNFVNMLPMGYHIYVMGSQSPHINYEFPPGIAIRIKANASLDFNSHYVNKTSGHIDGEVNVNFYTMPAASVQKEAKTLNLPNQNIVLDPLQKVTVSKSFFLPATISIIALTSHTHQLGEKFVIKIYGGPRDGEIVFTNLDWHHPPLITFDPPIVLAPGEGLTSEITYNNTTSRTVRFGLTSEDEMGIIFGYYTEN